MSAELNGDPLVTVLVPVWDAYAGPLLAEAVASVRQEGCPTRVLVVNNASSVPVDVPDGVELCTTPRRLTLGGARDFALQDVRTPYVVFWDADDVMLPGTLPSLLQGISAEPGLVAFGCAIVDAETGERHRWPRPWIAKIARHPRLFALLHSVWSLYPTIGSTVMRTDAVRASGGFDDIDSGDDWALGVSLLFRGRAGWSERPGRVYHNTPSSIWARHSTHRHLLAHARVVRRRIRTDPGIPSRVRLLLPVIWAAQLVVLGVVHAPVNAWRATRQRPVQNRPERSLPAAARPQANEADRRSPSPL